MRSLRSLVAAASILLASCTASTSSSAPAPSATPSGGTARAAELASGQPLPAGCDRGTPARNQTAALVADGRAWAIDAAGQSVTCLFRVSDPGPFTWGPLGDRALLGGLQMEQIGGRQLHPATSLQPMASSWGHPMGLAVVFVSQDGAALDKAYPGKKTIDDISPLATAGGATYKSVVYHPSGLALAFVATSKSGDAIWLSSNLGEHPQKLVFSEGGTTFGPLDFSSDGLTLAYGAEHPNGRPAVHTIDITNPTEAPLVWEGDAGEHIQSLFEQPRTAHFVAATLGSSCSDARAVILSGGNATTAIPDEPRPTRSAGWLDRSHVLVAAGGCGEKLDISSVDVNTLAVVPIATGVDVAAVRTPAPTPAPGLPEVATKEVGTGVG